MTSAIRIAVLVAGVMAVAGPSRAAGNERIATDDWSYAAIERFESLGLCTLHENRPFTRFEFERIVAEIATRAESRSLSGRDRYELDRLVREYGTGGERVAPRKRYDRAWFARDGNIGLEGDLDARPYVQQVLGGNETEVFVSTSPEVRVHIGERVTADVRYRIVMGPEHGDRARRYKPSRREKSFKGLTSLMDRSYVIAVWDQAQVLFGRDHVDWGPSQGGGLIAPGARYGIDQIGVRLSFKMLRLDAFYGQLFTDPERYVVGHRLEGVFGRTVVGVSETVTFGGRGPDMLYALPIAWLYANQYNERTNSDNILWSLDAKTSLLQELTVHASLLIDDFQFERDDGYPDKLALDAGVRWIPARPLGLALAASYRRVDIYTYSHEDSLSIYVSGAAEMEAGDVLLGGEPGPDSDVWRVSADVFPRPHIQMTVGAFGSRVGEGNDLRPFVLGTSEQSPPFPSGVVERATGVTAIARWELAGNSWVSADYTFARVENAGNVAHPTEDQNAFRVELRWEIP